MAWAANPLFRLCAKAGGRCPALRDSPGWKGHGGGNSTSWAASAAITSLVVTEMQCSDVVFCATRGTASSTFFATSGNATVNCPFLEAGRANLDADAARLRHGAPAADSGSEEALHTQIYWLALHLLKFLSLFGRKHCRDFIGQLLIVWHFAAQHHHSSDGRL